MKVERGLSLGILIIILFIIATLIKCSDDGKPREGSEGMIYYSFNWDKALSGYPVPERLYYCFYPADKGPSIQTESDGDGVAFFLPPGEYNLLIYNCDAQNINFRNLNDFETAEAYIPVGKASEEEISKITPLYGIVIENLVVKSGENSPVKMSPVPLVKEVVFNIKVDGIENVTNCTGSISNISYALNLSKQEVVKEMAGSLAFEAAPSEEGVNANVMILGKATPQGGGEEPSPVPSHEVALNFTLNDGSTVTSSLDIGTSLEETEGSKVEIQIDATIEKLSSFTLKINHWQVASGDSLVIE